MADRNCTGLDWEDVRFFIALARHGSLSATARAMSVSHVTVSRRIQSLERAMGQRLVDRRPDGYVLTPAGTQFLGPASDMESAASKLSRFGEDAQPRGVVRINAPPTLSQHFLAPRLAGLAARHTALDIDLSGDFRNVSLERRETDVALRYGEPQDGAVIAKRLVSMGFGFYASAQWERRISEGEPPTFVAFDEANTHLPEAQWLSQHFPRARMAFRGNGQLTQAAAARAGAGIALLPYVVARDYPSLKRCVLAHTPPPRDLWLLTRRLDHKEDLPCRTVVDFLIQTFAEERALFEEA